VTDLSTLALCLTALGFLHRLLPLWQRLVALRERALEIESTPPAREEATSIPGDLFALAQSYEDEWAREQALQAMREMYAESGGNWDIVRVNFARNRGRGDR
jgi:hypothetical protein